MGILFRGIEIIDIAVAVELSGIAFYEALAEGARDVAAQSVYRGLAALERDHLRTFEAMRTSLSTSKPNDAYTEDYDSYLKALVDSNVFRDDEAARQMARNAANDAQAIQMGMAAEKDSIVFYSEMRRIVPPAEGKVVDDIIAEEKAHLRQLANLKRRLAK